MEDELYERIFQLRSDLFLREDIEEVVKEKLLHSHATIEECEYIFHFLNMKNNQLEYDEFHYGTSQPDLFKVLEMI